MLESSRDLVYYVHYEEHDRRLDEWVPLSRFDLEALRRAPPPDGGELRVQEECSRYYYCNVI
jgi:hypothetical protein